jgi:cobaltochelatase CobT
MAAADNPADPFKKALAEASRTLAGDFELGVTYSADAPGLAEGQMRLPQISRRMRRDEVLRARGTADALALRLRYHDDATHARFAPQGDVARALYEAMETARCEAMGARHMPGTAGNIDACIAEDAARKGYADIEEASGAPLAVAAGYMIRHVATGRDLPAGADRVLALWRDHLNAEAGATIDGLCDALADQVAFARLARQAIVDLGYGDQLGDDPDETAEDEDDTDNDAASDDEEPDSARRMATAARIRTRPRTGPRPAPDMASTDVAPDDDAESRGSDGPGRGRIAARSAARPGVRGRSGLYRVRRRP